MARRFRVHQGDSLLETVRRHLHLDDQRPQEQDQDDFDDFDDDDDDDDVEVVLDPEIDLLQMLHCQEGCQRSLRQYQERIDQLLRNPDLHQRWQRFQRAGGASASDFEQFLNGRLRPKVIRQRKHLRLVASKKCLPLKLKKGNDGDAA